MPEMTCPNCGNRMRYNFEQGKIMCPHCGYAPLDARKEELEALGPRHYPAITYRGELSINARTAFHTAHDYLHRGDEAKALEHFRRSLAFQPSFTDAHLAIADLVADEATKRKHLSEVIAVDPGNSEALRRLMVLNGRLTQEQVARTYHYDDQRVERVDEVEATQNEVLLCPVCGGQLTVNEATGKVECRFCGYVAMVEPSRNIGVDSLAMALIERKVKPVRWVVGQRILHCNECGAERTIPARNLTHQCPFCGSQHVIQQDAVESLQQPDGLIQFRVSRQQAGAAIKHELEGIRHRIANLFDNNRVASGVLQAVYLPFWVFDAFGEVNIRRTAVKKRNNDGFSLFAELTPPPADNLTLTDQMANVAVCGVEPPPLALTARLGAYDYDAMIAYEPKLLAKHPAELYTIDFDKASLEARSIVARTLRDKHQRSEQDSQYEISVFTRIHHMDFRLVLLPVWVASLMEEDGDVRPALVNGQNGKVALGKAEKRR